MVEPADVLQILGGRFRLGERLEDGLGISTYLAQDLETGASVIVKTALDSALSEAIRLRVRREAAVLCDDWHASDPPILA